MNNSFTCIGRSHGAPAIPATRDEWVAQRKSPEVAEICIRLLQTTDAEEVRRLKSQLPVWTPRCARFRNNHRKESEALQPLPRLMLDIDEKRKTDLVLSHLKDGQIAGFRVLLLEESVRHGTHVLIELPEGMTPDDAQKAFAAEVGLAVDPAVKNVAGCIYQVPHSYTRYIIDDLFTVSDIETTSEATTKNDSVILENEDPKPADGDDAEGHVLTPEAAPSASKNQGGEAASRLTYRGFTYADIIRKYWQLYNEGKEPHDGDRNAKTYEIAMQLRSICNGDLATLKAVIPRYDGFPEAEWNTTLQNALKEPLKGVAFRIEEVMKALKKEAQFRFLGDSNEQNGQQYSDLPQRPKFMPAFLRLVSSRVPENLKAMVEESIWPTLCAHMTQVTFRYIDGAIHEANISSPLVGRQSVGKGKIDQPIEYLMADIKMRDELNKQRDFNWHQQNFGKEKRQPRPTDICIQDISVDLTQATLSQALIDAERNGGRRVITKVDEIEMLNAVMSGRNDKVALLVRYGFDTSRWGQRRVGADSVNGEYAVRWVWNASCTPKALLRFINRDWVSNGALSRLNLNALLLPKGRREMPIIKPYTEEYAQQLKPYIDQLNAASGFIACQQADKLAKDLVEEHNDVADLCESEGYRIFSQRAVVIGWIKANLLYILNNYHWTRSIADYVRYSVRRDMYLKMHFFGDLIEQEFNEEEKIGTHGPRNMLELLPAEFTRADYFAVRQQLGKQDAGLSTLRTWQSRGYIVWDESLGVYHKLKSKITT